MTDPKTVGAYNNLPRNTNFASGIQYKFHIRKLPTTNFFVQRVNIPSMTTQVATQHTPLQNLPLPGTTLTYGDLTLEFKVDEEFKNYLELFTWVNGLAFPKDTDEFASLLNESRDLKQEFGGIYSDAILHVLTNKSKPIINVLFREAFIYTLGEVVFRSTADDVDYLSCTAGFKYSYIDLENVT